MWRPFTYATNRLELRWAASLRARQAGHKQLQLIGSLLQLKQMKPTMFAPLRLHQKLGRSTESAHAKRVLLPFKSLGKRLHDL